MVNRLQESYSRILQDRGGIPSPPIAFEGSKESKALKVSSREISIDDRVFSRDVERSEEVSETVLKTE